MKLVLVLACLCLQGCFFLVPIPSQNAVRSALGKPPKEFEVSVQKHQYAAPHKAIAVLKGKRWLWGQSWGQADEETAKQKALQQCQEGSMVHGVEGECVLYSVDGFEL
jgi:hypothetical protein